MEYDGYDVMTRFPLLSASEDFTKWTGFITTALGQMVLLSIAVPEFPSAERVQLVTDDLEENAIQYWSSRINEISNTECHSFLAYLQLLQAQVLDGTPNENVVVTSQNGQGNAELYSSVIEEIEAIGIENVVSLSNDFKEIVIKHSDKSGREHQLKIDVPDGYPQTAPTVKTELPVPDDKIKWPVEITEINHVFKTHIEKYCSFWDDMEELDSCVRVLDPMPPNKSHSHRRILLDDNVMVHLVFNPLTPRAFPQISFAGPDKQVDAYNATVDRECDVWDDSLKVLQNLKSILNCEFVTRESEDDNGDNLDQAPCTICYVYNFEEEIPEITCTCGCAYHRQCIYDLFLTDAKSELKRCVECPNCQMEIRVPAAKGFGFQTW